MTLLKLLPIALILLSSSISGDVLAQSPKPSRQIGQIGDCTQNGQDGIRMDDNGDGIPDRCLVSQIKPVMNRANYDRELKQLQAQPCQKATRIVKNVSYIICSINGGSRIIISASEALMEVGDGVGYWLKGNRVRAIVFFGTGQVVFFNRGVLEAQMSDKGGVSTVFTADERRHFERLEKNGVQKILQVFGR